MARGAELSVIMPSRALSKNTHRTGAHPGQRPAGLPMASVENHPGCGARRPKRHSGVPRRAFRGPAWFRGPAPRACWRRRGWCLWPPRHGDDRVHRRPGPTRPARAPTSHTPTEPPCRRRRVRGCRVRPRAAPRTPGQGQGQRLAHRLRKTRIRARGCRGRWRSRPRGRRLDCSIPVRPRWSSVRDRAAVIEARVEGASCSRFPLLASRRSGRKTQPMPCSPGRPPASRHLRPGSRRPHQGSAARSFRIASSPPSATRNLPPAGGDAVEDDLAARGVEDHARCRCSGRPGRGGRRCRKGRCRRLGSRLSRA